MAQKVQVLLTCDLDANEKPATETVPFALDGTAYEIDLCAKHAKQLRDGLSGYVAGGRRLARTGARRRSSTGSGDGQRARLIREWARSKGIEVSERGRISADVVARYEAGGGRGRRA